MPIATPFYNFTMLLLRFDLSDLAEPAPPRGCGHTLPVLRRILGHSRNRATFPTGETRIAYFAASSRHESAALRKFQVIQTSLTKIEIRLVVHQALST